MSESTDLVFKDPSGEYVVRISEKVADRIKTYCQMRMDQETGGVLVGRYTGSQREAVVMFADGPPLDSKRGAFSFLRGVEGLAKKLAAFWTREGLYYLGEWHYHPLSAPVPSRTDHDCMSAIRSQRRVDCKVPILVIIGGNPQGQPLWSVTVYPAKGNPKSLPLLSRA